MAEHEGYPDTVALSEILRPRSIGDILDTTIRLYRRHFLLYFSIVMIVQAVVFVVSQSFQIPYNLMLRSLASGGGMTEEPSLEMLMSYAPLAIMAAVGFILLIAVSIAGYQFSTGGLVVAVAETFLGRSMTVGEAYQAVVRRFWSLLGAGLLVGLIEFAIVVVGMMLVAVCVIGGQALGGEEGLIIGVLVAFAPGGLTLLALIYAFLWFLLTPQAVMLEDATAVDSLRRSMQLMRDRSERGFFRNNLVRAGIILFVVLVINMIVAMLAQAPFFIALVVLAVLTGGEFMSGPAMPLWLQIPAQFLQTVGSALVMPIGIIALIIFYYDIRIRFEGFDLQVLSSAIDAR